jgi:putative membrane protein
MKYLGRIAAFIGLLAAIWLFWRENPRFVLALLRRAGPGLALVAVIHILPMLANAKDWQSLIRDRKRPGLRGMLYLVWIRESVNNLLPVARIGGEVEAYRVMRHRGMRAGSIIASLVVDTQLTLISQVLFTLVGIGYLLTRSGSGSMHLAGDLTWGVVALTPILILFSLVQKVRPFERMTRFLNKVTSGKLAKLSNESAEIDREMKATWRETGVIVRYLFVWQTLQSLGTAAELWIALRLMHAPISLWAAFVFDALLQALSSAAFFVPGNIGLQEGGFVLIGSAFGLNPATALALAGSRRIRDLLVFVPGLVACQHAESVIGRGRPKHEGSHAG